jgi:5-methylcytosine-specific restriction enzyme A
MAAPYAIKFYQSKQWRGVRAIVLNRDQYTCRNCYRRASEVHHIIGLTPDNIDDINISLNPDNLMCLCHDCHDRITKGFSGDVAAGYIFDDDGQIVPSPPS